MSHSAGNKHIWGYFGEIVALGAEISPKMGPREILAKLFFRETLSFCHNTNASCGDNLHVLPLHRISAIVCVISNLLLN